MGNFEEFAYAVWNSSCLSLFYPRKLQNTFTTDHHRDSPLSFPTIIHSYALVCVKSHMTIKAPLELAVCKGPQRKFMSLFASVFRTMRNSLCARVCVRARARTCLLTCFLLCVCVFARSCACMLACWLTCVCSRAHVRACWLAGLCVRVRACLLACVCVFVCVCVCLTCSPLAGRTLLFAANNSFVQG